jgi:hypothetical protein
MAKRLKILGIHGLGDHRNTTWEAEWRAALLGAVPGQPELVEIDFTGINYDDIFEKVDLTFLETMQAAWKLARSGLATALRRRRGVLGELPDIVRWTAGYVVAWVENERFQQQTRQRVLDAIGQAQPDVVLAHSLGSLVTYNAFSHADAGKAPIAAALRRLHYVTLGSQIGNAFVVGNLTHGRLEPLPVSRWSHLFNRGDDVFTAPIRLPEADNFQQVDTPFDIYGFADHSAVEYLKHAATIEAVWRSIAERRINARAFGATRRKETRRSSAARPTSLRKRALLVGINDYPAEGDRLEGCVNDVFLMSSVLQECGFEPESIRVCLDDRATCAGITERMAWLVDDPRPGDERLFYFSGHGARIPEYGENLEPDRRVETLVPHDFDWSLERAIVDDQIFRLYSQLPYETRFTMILDCCHSGGMHRQGGARVRGLNPPDDIRHRELKWDRASDMWVERDFTPLNRGFSSRKQVNAAFFGEDGTATRIGRASLVRADSETDYRRLKRRAAAPVGPYLPLIIEACQEKEYSYEYRHGVSSYGAFTYSLALELRKRKRITFRRLIAVTAERLRSLGYDQAPQILGPNKLLDARVPWLD